GLRAGAGRSRAAVGNPRRAARVRDLRGRCDPRRALRRRRRRPGYRPRRRTYRQRRPAAGGWVMGPADISDATASSLLGRTSPIVKLVVALGWLIGLAFTRDPRPPVAIAVVAIASGVVLGRVEITRLIRTILALGLAAIGIG